MALDDENRVFNGKIKSYNPDKGWGHIECPETREINGRDIFLLRTQLNGANVFAGDEVTFKLMEGRGGKNACDVRLVNGSAGGGDSFGGRGSDSREACGQFKKGECTRGASCRYSHGDGGGGGGGGKGAYGGGKGAYGGMPQPGFDPRFSPYAAMPPQNFGGYGMPGMYGVPAYGAPPMGGPPGGLPPGWEQAPDPSSGRPYYCNRSTGETRWDPPPAAAAGPAGGGGSHLPPGWESAADPGSGKTYYFNRSTNTTQWTPP